MCVIAILGDDDFGVWIF